MAIGADQLINFKKWKNYKEIINAINFIVFNRKEYIINEISNMSFTWVKNFNFNISSKEIREKIANEQSIADQLTPPISEYINKKQLYR